MNIFDYIFVKNTKQNSICGYILFKKIQNTSFKYFNVPIRGTLPYKCPPKGRQIVTK